MHRASAIGLTFLAGAGCTEAIDLWAATDGVDPAVLVDAAAEAEVGSADLGSPPDSAPSCDPDPCVASHRACVQGACAGCLPGWVDLGDGQCSPSLEPCDPDPCAALHKDCVAGFCGDCLPGFVDAGGVCLPPNACLPNPCLEPLRSVCVPDANGLPICHCNPGTHVSQAGACTFDACDPDPCAPPHTECTPVGFTALCGCPDGTLASPDGAACVDDPCLPNPCGGYAQTVCSTSAEGLLGCGCDPGFGPPAEGALDACVEQPIANLAPGDLPPPPAGDVVLSAGRQLFVDDWLVAAAPGFARRLHPLARAGDAYVVDADGGDTAIGRAHAGALVEVPEGVRAALPEAHPLKPFAYRLYYLGYRQLWAVDAQTAWLCLAVAHDPQGPWEKPTLDPEVPASHCMLRIDGLGAAEVSLVPGPEPQWVLSAARFALGEVTSPGLTLYGSPDGVVWSPLGEGASPAIAFATEPVPPSAYARVGDLSRLRFDPVEKRFAGSFQLLSKPYGDARGFMLGQADPSAGWELVTDPVACPAVFGPDANDLAAATVAGDAVTWREGSLWLSLVQKRRTACPKTAYAVLVASRDGRHWAQPEDAVYPELEAVIPNALEGGEPDASIGSLSGGGPVEASGKWHFFAGGLAAESCADPKAAGGVVRYEVRAAGLVGLETNAPATLDTRALRLGEGLVGSVLRLDARVDAKLQILVQALSEANTALASADVVLTKGEYAGYKVPMPPLNLVTAERFRIRFIFHGAGELFGFALSDPACDPNPCAADLEKPLCDSSSGEAVCHCAPPYHNDGLGGCTEDPCLPDPCTGPFQAGCTVVLGGAVCGCQTGYVGYQTLCVPDPCVPGDDGAPPCNPPGPDRCHAVEGLAECFCPEGSEATATGCVETHPRAFTTSLDASAGALGGRAGADQLCQNLASAAGLPGTFGAWLSAGSEGPGGRFVGAGPWRTWDPVYGLWTRLVAVDQADLVDGELGTALGADEFGQPLPSGARAWTGSLPQGFPPPALAKLGGDCQGWTAAAEGATALAGDCHAQGATWSAVEARPCSEKHHLYCLALP